MNINDIINLVNAGFTKSDIAALTAASAQLPETPTPATAAPAPELEPVNDSPIMSNNGSPSNDSIVQNDPAPAPELNQADILAAIDKKFDDVVSQLRGSLSPSIPDVKPQGVEDIISKFFKED